MATWLTPTSLQQERRRLGVLLGVMLLCFWPTLLSLPGTWNDSYRSHGYLVAGLIVWLVWRDRDRLVREAGPPIPDLLPIVALVSIAWMFTVVMNVQVIHQALFGVVFIGWALSVFGWAVRRRILALGATFLLALPVWDALVPLLQRATTIVSGGATRVAGISAIIGNDYITISSGTFLVEEGCAGINFLLGGLVLSAFYSHLFVERWQTQLKVVALAGSMSIVGNWIRVSTLIFIGEATAMQSAMLDDHVWQGWVIFTLLMIPTYVLANKIVSRDRVRFSTPTEADAPPTEGPMEDAGFDPRRPRRAAVAGFAAVLGPLLFMTIGAIPRGGALDRDPEVLGIIDSWTVTEVASTENDWSPNFHGIDEVAAWVARGDPGRIDGARYYFVDQRPGEELIQFGNVIAPDSLVASNRLVRPVGPTGRFVREAVIWDGDTPRMVWYWYRVAGFDTPLASKAKLLEVLAFFRRAHASELVTLMAECDPESCLNAARALNSATGGPSLPGGSTEVDSTAATSESDGESQNEMLVPGPG